MKKIILTTLLLFLLSTPVYALNTNYLPVYRYFNRTTGEHLYTADRYEHLVLGSTPGWRFEGPGWFYAGSKGEPVYRMFNPRISDHLYTKDMNEVTILQRVGWRLECGGQPLFWSNGPIPIYRLYNPRTGRHHLTTDRNEYNVLPQRGWRQEGVKLYATEQGDPL